MRKYVMPAVGVVLLSTSSYFFIQSKDTPAIEKRKLYSEQPLRMSPPLPETLVFAGETVPITVPDVRERLERELLINTYYHSFTILTLKKLPRWEAHMRRILRDNQVPEDFIYLMVAESAMRNATSPAGAQGFWQFMPQAARQYGLTIDETVDERNDPIKATHAACKYLKNSYEKFGNWAMVAASYNMGPTGVADESTKQAAQNYYDLYLNAETARYMFRILALKMLAQAPEQYGFKLFEEDYYKPTACKAVVVNQTIPSLVTFAKENGTTYKTLRMLNPWLRRYHLNVLPGKSYTLYVPDEKGSEQVGLVTE